MRGEAPQQRLAAEPSCSEQCFAAYSQWKESTPVATKTLLIAALFGYIAGCSGGYAYLANCPSFVFQKYQIYRPFFAAFFPRDWLNGLFSIMMFYQQLSPLEYRKGSMFAFLFPVIVATLTNWIFLLFMFIVGGGKISSQTAPTSSFDGSAYSSLSACSSGLWATACAVLALEAVLASESTPERRFYCFPCNLPTKWQPLLLIVLMSVMMGVSFDSYIGLALGYAYGMLGCCQPCREGDVFTGFVSRAENGIGCAGACFNWLTKQRNYVSLAAAQSASYLVSGADNQDPPPSGLNPSSAPPAPSRSSWNSGAGHSLRDSSTSGSSFLNVFSQPSAPALPPANPSRPGLALAERLERQMQQQASGNKPNPTPSNPSTHIVETGSTSAVAVQPNVELFTPLPDDYFSRPKTPKQQHQQQLKQQMDSLLQPTESSSEESAVPSNPYEYQSIDLNNHDDDEYLNQNPK